MTTTVAPRAGARWIGLLSLANLGLWMGYFGPLQVLLPNQIEDIAGGDKETALVELGQLYRDQKWDAIPWRRTS